MTICSVSPKSYKWHDQRDSRKFKYTYTNSKSNNFDIDINNNDLAQLLPIAIIIK